MRDAFAVTLGPPARKHARAFNYPLKTVAKP